MCSDPTKFTADHPQRIYFNQTKNATGITATTTRPPAVPAVFVLTKTNNKPMVVDFEGRVNRDVFIDMGEFSELHWGCGTTFYGEFWYFGGDYRDQHERQVSLEHFFILYRAFLGEQDRWVQDGQTTIRFEF